jgi:hypothetical protein
MIKISDLQKLKEQYEDLRGKQLDTKKLSQVSEMLSKLPKDTLSEMAKMDIAILSDIAKDKLVQVEEMAKDDAYAIGMAQAKKSMNDEPPLDKKTITKGHEIAKSIIKKEDVPAGSHKMPDGTIMKDKDHKKEVKEEPKIDQKKIDIFHKKLDNLVHKSIGSSSDEKKIKKESVNKTDDSFKTRAKAVFERVQKRIKEAKDLKEFTNNQISTLKKEYEPLRGKKISPEKATVLSKMLDKDTFDISSLKKLAKADIPFVSGLAKNKLYKKTGKFEAVKTPAVNPDKRSTDEDDIVESKIKDIFAADKEGTSVEDIAKKLKISVNKVKSILGESHYKPNSHVMVGNKTGQIVAVGQPEVGAYYTVKMDDGTNVQCKPEDITLVEKKIYKKIGKFEGAKAIVESITAVKNKAEKSNMPYSVLKQVYDRGMAAWKGGHRPGATQVQWALARVNSFITKSSGTWGGADSDLAKKVKGDK